MKIILPAAVGNALEWYDFTIYAQFSDTIRVLFFPGDDIYLATLATWGIFAAGFVMRPLGAVVFGIIGDRYGRRLALTLSILMMAVSTALMGLMPTYHAIGVWAPIALTMIRLVQGLALGGEFGGSMIYLTEHAPPNRRGLVGSFTMSSMCIGVLMGSMAATAIHGLYSDVDVLAGVWRYPFLISFALGLFGLYLRRDAEESPYYLRTVAAGQVATNPVATIMRHYRVPFFHIVIIYCTSVIPFYTFVIYMKVMLYQFHGFSHATASLVATISLIVMTAMVTIGGLLSDHYGRRVVMQVTCVGFMVLTYPAFLCFGGSLASAFLGSMILALLVGIYNGPIPALLAELFPTEVRLTGVSMAYNTSAAIFGGPVPVIYTALIKETGFVNVVAFYVIFFACLSFLSLCAVENRKSGALSHA